MPSYKVPCNRGLIRGVAAVGRDLQNLDLDSTQSSIAPTSLCHIELPRYHQLPKTSSRDDNKGTTEDAKFEAVLGFAARRLPYNTGEHIIHITFFCLRVACQVARWSDEERMNFVWCQLTSARRASLVVSYGRQDAFLAKDMSTEC
jgi:hypothetical protein